MRTRTGGKRSGTAVNQVDVLGRKLLPGNGFGTRDQKRLEAAQRTLQNREKIKSLFLKHDTDKSSRLDHGELKSLLEELSGKDLHREEVSFVLQMADNAISDGEIEMDEIAAAIAAWNVLQADQDFWEGKFSEFDPTGVGGLDVERLHEVLVQLNGGDPVERNELDWLMRRADLDKNGLIDRQELRVAVAIWYTHVNFRKSGAKHKKGGGCCGK